MSKTKLLATVTKGLYKDSAIEIEFGKDHASSSVFINGKKVDNCMGVYIKITPNKPTRCYLEFVKDE